MFGKRSVMLAGIGEIGRSHMSNMLYLEYDGRWIWRIKRKWLVTWPKDRANLSPDQSNSHYRHHPHLQRKKILRIWSSLYYPLTEVTKYSNRGASYFKEILLYTPTSHYYAEHSSMTTAFYSVCNNLKVIICMRKNELQCGSNMVLIKLTIRQSLWGRLFFIRIIQILLIITIYRRNNELRPRNITVRIKHTLREFLWGRFLSIWFSRILFFIICMPKKWATASEWILQWE
jgi:hypothetical protein